MSFKRYFTRKPMTELADEAKNSHELERTLSAFQLMLLGVGAIVGAGIFVFVGLGASHAGPAVILSFVLGGLACACAALCYAELASAIPISGSSYTYTYATLGELPAWIMAGCVMLTYIVAPAAVAGSWSGYFVSLLSDYGIHLPAQWVHTTGQIIQLADGSTVTAIINLPALCLVSLLAFVVFYGANASATINAIIVMIKVTILLAFVVLGSMHIDPNNWIPFIPENTGEYGKLGISGIVSGTAAIFLAYMGFDTVATAAQEAKNPQRDLPIGIIGSLAISTVIYVLIAGVLTGLESYTELGGGQPLAIAVAKMNMPWFSIVIKMGAVIGLASVVLVMLYASVRILYTVTHDGLLPIGLAKCHKKHHTPHILTILASIIVGLLSSMVHVEHLALLADFGALVTFAMVCVCALYLRYKMPHIPRGFTCPWMPFIPIIGIILFLQILYGLPAHIFTYAAIWISFIVVVYFVYGQFNSKLQKEIQHGDVPESTLID